MGRAKYIKYLIRGSIGQYRAVVAYEVKKAF